MWVKEYIWNMKIMFLSLCRMSESEASEERKCNYERYRVLVQNESTAGKYGCWTWKYIGLLVYSNSLYVIKAEWRIYVSVMAWRRPGKQAIIWTNAGILWIGSLGTNFSEISIKIHTFSFKKMLSSKWGPFCLGLNVLCCCRALC